MGFTVHLLGSYNLLLTRALRHGGRFVLLIFLRQFWLAIEVTHVAKNMHVYVSTIPCL